MSGIMIDPERLIEFFDRHQEESCGYGYDISTTDELRQFLYDFCHNEVDFGFGFTCKASKESKIGPKVYDNILFKSHDEAELVLKKMKELIKTKGFATVADYYLFSNKPAAVESVYYDWGWRSMNGAYAFSWLECGNLVHTLKLPDPVPMNANDI